MKNIMKENERRYQSILNDLSNLSESELREYTHLALIFEYMGRRKYYLEEFVYCGKDITITELSNYILQEELSMFSIIQQVIYQGERIIKAKSFEDVAGWISIYDHNIIRDYYLCCDCMQYFFDYHFKIEGDISV